MGKFATEMRARVDGTKRQIDQDVRRIQFLVFGAIITESPVDTGRFRGNWQTSVSAPAVGVLERLDTSGELARADVIGRMGGAGEITFFVNNLPYAETLEYGGFPSPPKFGTWVPGVKGRKRKDGTRKVIRGKEGHYEIRSSGGFSKRAPQGMVRITMARVPEIASAVRAARGA